MTPLSTAERGAVVAAVMTGGEMACAIAARVSERCRMRVAELLALDRDTRAGELARELAAIDSPVPANLSRVHRDWIESALAGETSAVRNAVAGGTALADAARQWLQRRTFGHLVGMPSDTSPGPLAAAARAPVAALVTALAGFGRDALAAALCRAAPREVAAVAARLGEPHGSLLVARVAELARAEASAGVRHLAALVHADAGAAPEQTLVRAGVRRLALAIGGMPGDAPRQLAQRLPWALGSLLCDELRQRADAAPDDASIAAFCDTIAP